MHAPSVQEFATPPGVDEENLSCPLCGYDLRGLSAPRCPECGSRFAWAELRDPAKKLHPYLFEHHPEKNVRSFVRTLLGGLAPWRFWRTLLPIQPSRPKRLFLYALICAALLIPIEALQFTRTAMELRQNNLMVRARMLPFYTGGNSGIYPGIPVQSVKDAWRQFWLRTTLGLSGRAWFSSDAEASGIIRTYGSVQKYLDQQWPLPPSARFLAEAWRFEMNWSSWGFRPSSVLMEILLAGTLWPWLVTIAFQVFRATMRRAKIRPTHLLRVAIYSGDVAVWLGLALAVPVVAEILSNLKSTPAVARGGAWVPPGGAALSQFMYGIMFWAPILAIILATIRLAAAVKYYLRFDRAVATVICVQVMVFLALWKLHFVSHGM